MSTPVLGSQLVCGVSPTLDANNKMVPVRIAVDDSFTPPRIVIELPDRALRDLGRVRVFDGTTVATVRDLAANDALNVAIVDGSGGQITSFGGGTQYAEDTAHVSGDQVTMAGVVQQAADAALSTDLDRSLLQVDGSGWLKVNVKAGGGGGIQYTEGDIDATITGTAVMWEDAADTLRPASAAKPLPTAQQGALPAGDNNIGNMDVVTLPALVAGTANIGDVDVLTMPTGASAANVQGDVANDGVDSGNPVKVGGLASGAIPTAVAAADRVNAYHDREGRQIVRPWGAGDWAQVNFPAVNTRASSTKAAGGAGVRHVCTGLTAALAAGTTAPAAVQLDVRVRDGILDAGTILWQMVITLPATAGAMNGVALSGLNIRGTAATAMTIEFSLAGGANTFESVAIQGVDITES